MAKKRPGHRDEASTGRTRVKTTGTGESSKNRPGENESQRQNKARGRTSGGRGR